MIENFLSMSSGANGVSQDDYRGGPRGIQKVRSIEPQRGYQWEVTFPNPFLEDGADATFHAVQTAIPTGIVENLKRYYNGVEYAYPGRDMSPRIFRLTIWDNQNMDNFRFFETWRQSCSYTHEQYKTPNELHSRDITLTLFDHSDTVPHTSIVMRNSKPTEVGESSLVYDSSILTLFDVLFHYSHKEVINASWK